MVEMMKSVTLAETKTAMRKFLYLGTVDKVRTALANEFSPYVPMPSANAIQDALDRRKRGLADRPRHGVQRRVA
jgi:hypothetical protein